MLKWLSNKDTGRFLNSFASRNTRKIIGGGLLALAFFFASPPIMPPPDDFLNIGVATYLVSLGWDLLVTLIFTYTAIPLLLIILGIIIFPKKDGAVGQLIVNKIRSAIELLKNPRVLILALIFGAIMIYFYMKIIEQVLLPMIA